MSQDPFERFLAHCRNEISGYLNSRQFQKAWPQALSDYLDTESTFARVELSVQRYFGAKCDSFSTLGIKEYDITCVLPGGTLEELLEIADEIVKQFTDTRVEVNKQPPAISLEEADFAQKMREELGNVPGPEYLLVIKGFYAPLALSRRT